MRLGAVEYLLVLPGDGARHERCMTATRQPMKKRLRAGDSSYGMQRMEAGRVRSQPVNEGILVCSNR